MDLELSAEESELRDNVRSVLASVCPPAAVRAVFEGKGDPASIWDRMVELDWPALAIAEDHGGLGLGFVEVALVAEELGRAVVPGPFLATVDAVRPGRARARRRCAAGRRPARPDRRPARLTGTVALAERGRWEPAGVATTAEETADGWVLAGTKDAVLDGADADEVLVVARAAGTSGTVGLGAFVVPRADLTATARTVIDPTLPLADLALDGVVVPAPPGPGRARRRRGGRGARPRGAGGDRRPRRLRGGRVPARSSSRPSPTPRSASSTTGRSGRSRPSSTAWPTCTSPSSGPRRSAASRR